MRIVVIVVRGVIVTTAARGFAAATATVSVSAVRTAAVDPFWPAVPR